MTGVRLAITGVKKKRKEKKEKEKSIHSLKSLKSLKRKELFTVVSKTGASAHEFWRQIMSADLYSRDKREFRHLAG